MARTVSLTTLLAEVRYRADAESLTARHPDSSLTRAINQSIQRLREKVSQLGYHLYLTSSTGTTSVGPVTGFSYGSIPWPSGAVRIFGIDVTYQNGDIRTLAPIQFEERNDFRDAYGQNQGIPYAFHVLNIGAESGSSVTPGTIALFPAPNAAYPYAIWYMPTFTDLAAGSDVFNGVDGWEEWIIWDVVAKVAARDNDMQTCYAIAVNERDRLWADVLVAAKTIQRAGPARRNDVAARNRTNRTQSFWRRS